MTFQLGQRVRVVKNRADMPGYDLVGAVGVVVELGCRDHGRVSVRVSLQRGTIPLVPPETQEQTRPYVVTPGVVFASDEITLREDNDNVVDD